MSMSNGHPYPAGSRFVVVKTSTDFPLDFEVVDSTPWVCHIKNNNGEVYTLSPLVIGERLRSGHIQREEDSCPPE